MHNIIEMKQGCGGWNPSECILVFNLIKHKNDMHAPAALQKL